MLDRIVTQIDLLAAIAGLAHRRRVIGPVARDGRFFYQEIEHPALLELDFNYCVYGPKAFLFPPTETLFTFEPFTGPAAKEFTIPPLEAGEYSFHCDVHPTMAGTVAVA